MRSTSNGCKHWAIGNLFNKSNYIYIGYTNKANSKHLMKEKCSPEAICFFDCIIIIENFHQNVKMIPFYKRLQTALYVRNADVEQQHYIWLHLV